MEGLSLAFKRSQEEGLLMSIKVSRLIKILHLLFVDDILIVTKASIVEWQEIKRVLRRFCSASGLKINDKNNYFLQHGGRQHELEILKANFHYNFIDLFVSFRYLGYYLKIDGYKKEDRQWFISKYGYQISH